MKPTKAESIAKLAQWCVENSSETFDLLFQYGSDDGYIELIVYEDGYDSMNGNDEIFSIYIDNHGGAYIEEWANETITELNMLLAKSNFRNCKMLKSSTEKAKTIVTPAMTQYDLKAEREADELAKAKADLAKAKAVIARLEGK